MPDTFDPLDRFWAIFDFAEPLVCAEQTVWWEPGALDALIQAGLLTPTTAAAQATCTACDERHVEEVEFEQRVDGSLRCLIPCPASSSPVEIDPAMLRQWRPDFKALAGSLRELLRIEGRIRARVPDRLWRLGNSPWGRQAREVYLARGLAWPDGSAIARQIPCDDRPIVFVALYGPAASAWPVIPPAVVPLHPLLTLDDGQLQLDHGLLAQWVAGADATALAQGTIASGEMKRAVQRYAEQRMAQGTTADMIRVFHSQGMSDRQIEREFKKRGVQIDHTTVARKRPNIVGSRPSSSKSILRDPSLQPRNTRGRPINEAQPKAEE